MSGRVPRQFIDDLLVRVDIVDLIDSRLPLKKSGSNFVARCPFHTEKTPSFSVNRSRQIYHCFGCGTSGNAISFLMAFNHLGFVEAVEDLANFIGIEVPREDGSTYSSDKQDHSKIYALLDKVSTIYQQQLNHPNAQIALDYLNKRGLSAEITKDFGLGYAPSQWNTLLQQFDQSTLADAGLIVVKEDGNAYDRFRGRLMFPIRDKRKRVIGFGGRVLDDSLPKYLNSPETSVFTKGKEVYGLSELLEKHPKPARIVLVEGYMDVIALAQFGFTQAVASLGTATSKNHMDALFRLTTEIILCFDGDRAGQEAAWKAVETALPCLRDGRQIKVMWLPDGQDPDTLIRDEGLTGFQQRLTDAQLLSDYFFQHQGQGINLSSMEGRSQLIAKAKPLIEKIPLGFFRDMMLARLRELSGAQTVSATPKATARHAANKPHIPQPSVKSNLLRKLLSLLLQYPYLAKHIEQQTPAIASIQGNGAALLTDLLHTIATQKPENSGILLEHYRCSTHEKTINALTNLTLEFPAGGEEAEFCGVLTQLIKQADNDHMDALIAKVSRGEMLTDTEKRTFITGGKTNH